MTASSARPPRPLTPIPVPPEFADDGPPVAIVTGAARRLGSSFARALALGGWRVVLHCLRSRAEAQALADTLAAEGAPTPVVCAIDLADPAAPERLLAETAAAGVPRLLVNNASQFVLDQMETMEPELWDRHMAVNLRAPAFLTQAVGRALNQAEKNGLVVQLLDAKLSSPNPDYLSYTVSKQALGGFTELAARALAPRVRVNALAPSITLTWDEDAPAERFEKAHRLNPLGRGVEAADLASALGWLVATPTITGQTLTIDAGQRFLGLPRDVSLLDAP